jgi:hypothetical protein
MSWEEKKKRKKKMSWEDAMKATTWLEEGWSQSQKESSSVDR